MKESLHQYHSLKPIIETKTLGWLPPGTTRIHRDVKRANYDSASGRPISDFYHSALQRKNESKLRLDRKKALILICKGYIYILSSLRSFLTGVLCSKFDISERDVWETKPLQNVFTKRQEISFSRPLNLSGKTSRRHRNNRTIRFAQLLFSSRRLIIDLKIQKQHWAKAYNSSEGCFEFSS